MLYRPQAYSRYRVLSIQHGLHRPVRREVTTFVALANRLNPVTAALHCGRRSGSVLPSSADYSLGGRRRYQTRQSNRPLKG
jgi:hypothetical protein